MPEQFSFFPQEGKEKEKKALEITMDKLLTAIILLLLMLVFSFYLGVKTGEKRFRPPAQQAEEAPARRPEAPAQQAKAEEAKAQKKEKGKEGARKAKAEAGGKIFTVQLATYSPRNEALADKQIETLKKKGYSAFKLRFATYISLCAGRFENRRDAQGEAAVLRKYYPDCFIKEVKK